MYQEMGGGAASDAYHRSIGHFQGHGSGSMSPAAASRSTGSLPGYRIRSDSRSPPPSYPSAHSLSGSGQYPKFLAFS